MIKHEDLVIDLSKIVKLTGMLFPDEPYELRLVELFKLYYNDDNEPIGIFTNELLKRIYNDNVDRGYDEITNFYKEKDYISTVFGFLNTLEYILLNRTHPDVTNIEFTRWEIKTDTVLVAIFKVSTYEEDK